MPLRARSGGGGGGGQPAAEESKDARYAESWAGRIRRRVDAGDEKLAGARGGMHFARIHRSGSKAGAACIAW